MPSFLPQIRAAIAKGFRGRLLTGQVRRYGEPILNDFNDVETLSYTDYSFDGIRENFDAQYQSLAEIPATDIKILIILGSLSIVPTQQDEIFISGAWHRIRRVLTVDPASASMALQAYQVPGPSSANQL